jgi:multisubunit Na+/H+ antiporter MnhB subunit
MELQFFLTYIGLLITAYNVNEEHRKIKIKLSLIRWRVIFFITLLLLFISSNVLIKELNIQTYFYNFI